MNAPGGKTCNETINFRINGKVNSVNPTSDVQVGPDARLVDFIRDRAGLKGTKFMCREGGCGACIVTVKSRNPNTGEPVVRSVNSCLTPVLACDGWDITTIEGLGSVKGQDNLHPIQDRMVKFHGTQCGFCTPGMIMNVHGTVLGSKKVMGAKDIEDCIDGNICRCTGYRPILDAMKSLAKDGAPEKLCAGKCAADKNSACASACAWLQNNGPAAAPLILNLKSGSEWVRAVDLNSLFTAIQGFRSRGLRYRIVAGNTGTGVYKEDGPYDAFVEVGSVPVLSKIAIDSNSVTLGGSVTISEAIETMKKAADLDHGGGFRYCQQVAGHWKRVANTAVRNVGTLAGNLMLKHQHREFPSDVFIVLEAIGATLKIASAPNLEQVLSPSDFLKIDMTGKVIQSIQFPKLKDYHFRSFKISRRYQNAHAYVNAGFLFQTDSDKKFSVVGRPRIVFGGIDPNFTHAVATESFLTGKSLDDKNTVQVTLATLDEELKPDSRPTEGDPLYRKSLTKALLYKFILGILGDQVNNKKLTSGGSEIERGLSSGRQDFDTNEIHWPVHEPIPKIEAPVQCTGEASYANDICPEFGELFGVFVVTKVGNARLGRVDASEALKIPGVVSFVDVNDIPGTNNYMTNHCFPYLVPDEIFVKDKIVYAGQPIGLILADTREIAQKAVKQVKIEYTDIEKPVLDIPSALEKAKNEGKLEACTFQVAKSEKTVTGTGGVHSISGEFVAGSQYHFHMEPQVCICVPREDGMDVYPATQWPTQMQGAIAECLNLPSNSVNIKVRRLGGGFGGKLARTSHIATACAVAANKVNRPVRVVVDLESAMSILGKRHPYLFKYTVTFDDTGKVISLDVPFFSDAGCSPNEVTAMMGFLCMQSCYNTDGWQVSWGQVHTNSPPNTYVRAPGSVQSIGCLEYIMDHIAFQLKKDPVQVRLANLLNVGDDLIAAPGQKMEEASQIPHLITELMTKADIEERKRDVEKFNETNRWKKRGLAVSAMRYKVHYWFSGYNCLLSVYARDGTVSLSHSGIEMGQGLNTKVVQVVAKELNVSVDKIKVRPLTTLVSPNGALTGGSVTSEHVCHAAMKAAQILNARLAPIREKLEGESAQSWETVVAEGQKAGVDLTACYNTTSNDGLKDYNVWGVAACEVEIDCLTGEYKLARVDLINDAGLSLSPNVDVGQVEGAFVMGLGLWLTEKIEYDQNTGELLTNRTWDYKVPLAKDIPEDFRVTLMKNSVNPHGVLRSKATGEAPICLSIVALLAIKQAIAAARKDAGNTDWFQLGGPVMVEDIQKLCLSSDTQFVV